MPLLCLFPATSKICVIHLCIVSQLYSCFETQGSKGEYISLILTGDRLLLLWDYVLMVML